ncbi:4Fe-4S dicluster domain-containing protein [Candidatus Bathyarchaeota archaeon]|nr:MAG: 4Fe-4S dicluster domain-containing protein [Candidatus Bathyarchaeota archaeon]
MAMENELFRNLKQKPVTLQFPYEREEPVEGVRAKVSWNIDKCVGCLLCVRVCPGNAIEILGRGRKAEIKYNIGRCLFCGECVDVCPTKAIYTTKEFELVFNSQREMIIHFKRKKRSGSD